MTTALIVIDPTAPTVPLVLDSPHSGTAYPADFGYACDGELLRRAEDTHVQDLFGNAPAVGATLLHALFPRSYIDVNRAEDDIDPDLLAEPWPGELRPSDKSALGMGLIRKLCVPGMAMYDRPLSVAEIKGRIQRCYRPYHAELARLLDKRHERFGRVYHIDCHSMPDRANAMNRDAGARRPDFCISDRDGSSADSAFTELVADTLASYGWDVRINDPYRGAELIMRHGRPADQRHSIQIEVNRARYMDEDTRQPHDGYQRVKGDLTRMLRTVAAWIKG